MRVSFFPFLAVVCALAQTPDPKVTFEVATVKASAPPEMGRIRVGMHGGPGAQDPGRFTCENCNLSMLITTAYDIDFINISGPDFMNSQRFDIVAKVPEGATKEQFRVMLQNLLIERFKLAVHHDKKDMPIYELTVAKNGPKLKASTGPAESPNLEGRGAGAAPPPPVPRDMGRGPDGGPQLPPGRYPIMMMGPKGARARQVDQSMPEFAKWLQRLVGRPVNDATGLTGKYDIELSFSQSGGGAMMIMGGKGAGPLPPPPPGPAPGGAGGSGGPESASMPEDNGPTIFAALQEQLGLKLEPKKGPVDVLVVDHIEKTPTEN